MTLTSPMFGSQQTNPAGVYCHHFAVLEDLGNIGNRFRGRVPFWKSQLTGRWSAWCPAQPWSFFWSANSEGLTRLGPSFPWPGRPADIKPAEWSSWPGAASATVAEIPRATTSSTTSGTATSGTATSASGDKPSQTAGAPSFFCVVGSLASSWSFLCWQLLTILFCLPSRFLRTHGHADRAAARSSSMPQNSSVT